MEATIVNIKIKNINSFYNYFTKYNKEINFNYLTFNKKDNQLWVVGELGRSVISLEKIDYDEVFIIDDNLDLMPEFLCISFWHIKKFIKMLELIKKKKIEDVSIMIEFEQFLDFEYKINDFILLDDKLSLSQEVAAPVYFNLYTHIGNIQHFGGLIIDDLLITLKDKYNTIIAPLPIQTIHEDFKTLFIDTVKAFYLKGIQHLRGKDIIAGVNLLSHFDTTTAIFKFGLKESVINMVRNSRILNQENETIMEFDSLSEPESLIIKLDQATFTYRDGYLQCLKDKLKFKLKINFNLFKHIPREDYDVSITEKSLILESRRTNFFLAVKVSYKNL